jgi:hypothetical protein
MATVKSGYNAKFVVGGTSLLQSEDISVEVNHEPIDITDLQSTYRERCEGILDWSVTCRSKYASQQVLTKAVAGRTSVLVTIREGSAATGVIFSGLGFVTTANVNFPMGATNQSITVVGNGGTPSVT